MRSRRPSKIKTYADFYRIVYFYLSFYSLSLLFFLYFIIPLLIILYIISFIILFIFILSFIYLSFLYFFLYFIISSRVQRGRSAHPWLPSTKTLLLTTTQRGTSSEARQTNTDKGNNKQRKENSNNCSCKHSLRNIRRDNKSKNKHKRLLPQTLWREDFQTIKKLMLKESS